MPIKTGVPAENRQTEYKHETLTDGEQARILKWNRDMKRATQGLGLSDKLPKDLESFKRLKFLPVFWARREEGSLPGGKIFKDVTHFEEVHSFQLTYPARLNVIGGSMTSEPVTKTHWMNGTSTRGDHIAAGYTPEQCALAIIMDPNWGDSYLVWPISEEEDAQLAGFASSPDSISAVEQRKALMDEADRRNAASRKFGINPGQKMPGERETGPIVPLGDLMAQTGVGQTSAAETGVTA